MKIKKIHILIILLLLSISIMIFSFVHGLDLSITLKYEIEEPKIIYGENKELLALEKRFKFYINIYRTLMYMGLICIFCSIFGIIREKRKQ